MGINNSAQLLRRLEILHKWFSSRGLISGSDDICDIIQYVTQCPEGGTTAAELGTPQLLAAADAGPSSVPVPLPLDLLIPNLADVLGLITKEAVTTASRNGFKEAEWGDWEAMAVRLGSVHLEVSEAMFEIRKPNPDPRLFTLELVDIILRVLGMSTVSSYSLSRGLVEKMMFNRARGWRHGGKNF